MTIIVLLAVAALSRAAIWIWRSPGNTGDRAQALGIVKELNRMEGVSPMNFAGLYVGLGDANQTFEWLEKAYQAHETRIHELRSVEFDSVRQDPRYPDLMRRIGLPLRASALK